MSYRGGLALREDVIQREDRFETPSNFRRLDIKKVNGAGGLIQIHQERRTGKLFVVKALKNFMKAPTGTGESNEIYICRHILTMERRERERHLVKIEHFCARPSSSIETGKIWLEYCILGDMEDLCRRRGPPVPEGFIWHILLRLTEALAWLHQGLESELSDACLQPNFASSAFREKLHPYPKHKVWPGIVHRDIKPANIFFRYRPGLISSRGIEYPDPVLADFGCSAILTHSTFKTIFNGGTKAYSQPEYPTSGRRADIFQLGLSIYSLATDDDIPKVCLMSDYEDRGIRPPPVKKLGSPYSRDLCQLLRYVYLERDPEKRSTGTGILYDEGKLIAKHLSFHVGDRRRGTIGDSLFPDLEDFLRKKRWPGVDPKYPVPMAEPSHGHNQAGSHSQNRAGSSRRRSDVQPRSDRIPSAPQSQRKNRGSPPCAFRALAEPIGRPEFGRRRDNSVIEISFGQLHGLGRRSSRR